MEERVFKIIFSAEADEFLSALDAKVRKKILLNIDRVACGEKNSILFSKLSDSDIWEFRTLFNKMIYRLFAFWDTESSTIIVTTHGIVKKTQKTPPKEIAKAEKIRQRYFELKKKK
ncbi:MAG: type II toxin-antitoxin system RelE/ParE family toxin [Prevotella sp.]